MSTPTTPSPHRLPDTVIPRRYDLELRPDIDAAVFSGDLAITVEVTEPTDSITLHALDLAIDAVEVESTSGHTWGIEATPAVHADTASEQIRLALPGELPAGSAQIRFRFRGVLNDQLVGFYRSTFTRADPSTGEPVEHAIAVTQFESTHARRAFPCFDEPAFKAVFSVSLVVPSGLFAVSNGAEVSRVSNDDGTDLVRFADTIPMSTYLVAFVVGPLEATEPRRVPGQGGTIPLRVVHPPGSAHLCDFALDVAEAALHYFESYYELPYPGDKLDLVAVPDFAFGAMENLGCVTFREVLLLIDPASATQPELQRVADVINHELAHMWFGDLVTMSWWNGIWLNEAFATFMEVMASDYFRPDWDVWTTFGLARSAAFDTDALLSTRPIEYEVVTAADSEAMFDILTYEKGASVVRMLEQYLGAERFRVGIAEYLRRHAYGNTETTDLWDALEESTGEPVRRIMDHWIFRGGHPIVHIEPTESGLRLSQERFTYRSSPDDTAPAEEPWPVPMVLAFTSCNAPSTVRFLLDGTGELQLDDEPTVVRGNLGGNGFYRVGLSSELRRALSLEPPANPLERFVLLDDTWAEFVAGRVPLDELVELVRTLAVGETDTSMWKRIASALRRLVELARPDHAAPMIAVAAECVGPALRSVEDRLSRPDGTADVDHARDQELRGVLFSLAGTICEDPAVRSRARVIFAADLDPEERAAVDAPMRAAAVDVLATTATPTEHGELERRWRTAPTPQEELRYLYALVDTPDPDLFDHALELAANEVRTQNAPYLVRRALAHPTLSSRAWGFVQTHWDHLVERFPSNSVPRMLEGIRSIADPDTATAVEAFLADHPVPSGELQVGQHVERMWVSVAARKRVLGALGSQA